MKKLLSIFLLSLSPAAACAADLGGRAPTSTPAPSPSLIAPEPAASWNGFYGGLHLGHGATGKSTADLSPVVNGDSSDISATLSRSGSLGGLQAGYQLQSGSVVYGVEADLAVAGLRGSQSADGVLNSAPANARLDAKTGMVGTMRGRIGYAVDRFLVYGTGGLAFAEQKSSLTLATLGGSSSGSSSAIYAGWTLGLGAEYALTRNISAKAEYLYARVGEGLRGKGDAGSLQMLRTGVNYRF